MNIIVATQCKRAPAAARHDGGEAWLLLFVHELRPGQARGQVARRLCWHRIVFVHLCFPDHALSARDGTAAGMRCACSFYGTRANTDEHRWSCAAALCEHACRSAGRDGAMHCGIIGPDRWDPSLIHNGRRMNAATGSGCASAARARIPRSDGEVTPLCFIAVLTRAGGAVRLMCAVRYPSGSPASLARSKETGCAGLAPDGAEASLEPVQRRVRRAAGGSAVVKMRSPQLPGDDVPHPLRFFMSKAPVKSLRGRTRGIGVIVALPTGTSGRRAVAVTPLG